MAYEEHAVQPVAETNWIERSLQFLPRFAVLVCWAVTILAFADILPNIHPTTRGDSVDPPWAPLSAALSNVTSKIALVTLAGAFAGTVLLLTPWRKLAGYVGLFALSAAHLMVLPIVAGVQPGPSVVERYIGENRYLEPWQCNPRGNLRPSKTAGFHINNCPKVAIKYAHLIDGARIEPDNHRNLGEESDVKSFLQQKDGYRRLPAYNYEAYMSLPVEQKPPTWGHRSQGQEPPSTIYLRRRIDDSIIRFVRCSFLLPDKYVCLHHVLKAGLKLEYSTKTTEVELWEDMDQRIVDLIASWRADRSLPEPILQSVRQAS